MAAVERLLIGAFSLGRSCAWWGPQDKGGKGWGRLRQSCWPAKLIDDQAHWSEPMHVCSAYLHFKKFFWKSSFSMSELSRRLTCSTAHSSSSSFVCGTCIHWGICRLPSLPPPVLLVFPCQPLSVCPGVGSSCTLCVFQLNFLPTASAFCLGTTK